MSEKPGSPYKILGLTIASGILNIGAGILGASAANKRKREAAKKEAK